MDDGGEGPLPAGGAVRCEVCGRPIELAPQGLPGAPGLGAGSVIDNRRLCKSCQAGRYRSEKAKGRGRRP